jgi:hemoglobin
VGTAFRPCTHPRLGWIGERPARLPFESLGEAYAGPRLYPYADHFRNGIIRNRQRSDRIRLWAGPPSLLSSVTQIQCGHSGFRDISQRRVNGQRWRQCQPKRSQSLGEVIMAPVIRIAGANVVLRDSRAHSSADHQIRKEKKMRKQIVPVLLAGLVALSATLMSGESNGALYKSLGGKKAITAVVDDFVARVAADNRINGFFKQTASDPKRLASFKMKLVDQICEASGGPCKYTGKDMKSAHAGMGIASGDFNALVEDLVATLDKFHVKEADKNALLGVLGPIKNDVVEK